MPPIIGKNMFNISHVSPLGKPSSAIIVQVRTAVAESGGSVAVIIHPDYYRMHIKWYGRDPFGDLKNSCENAITEADNEAYMARLKEFMNTTSMPAFVFLDGTKGWNGDSLPSFLSWYQPKAPSVFVPTLTANPTPEMFDTVYTNLQWTAFLILLRDMGVKKVTIAGELAYTIRNRWFKPITGCLDNARDAISLSFPVSADPKLSFPNAVMNVTFLEMCKIKLRIILHNLDLRFA